MPLSAKFSRGKSFDDKKFFLLFRFAANYDPAEDECYSQKNGHVINGDVAADNLPITQQPTFQRNISMNR